MPNNNHETDIIMYFLPTRHQNMFIHIYVIIAIEGNV